MPAEAGASPAVAAQLLEADFVLIEQPPEVSTAWSFIPRAIHL